MCVFLRIVAKFQYRFLQQRINTELCVKLENNATDTHSIPSEACGGEAMKVSHAFD
jgi:hypothetical protein